MHNPEVVDGNGRLIGGNLIIVELTVEVVKPDSYRTGERRIDKVGGSEIEITGHVQHAKISDGNVYSSFAK